MSLVYLLVYLLVENLPWLNLGDYKLKKKFKMVKSLKKQLSPTAICIDDASKSIHLTLVEPLIPLLQYANSLQFS